MLDQIMTLILPVSSSRVRKTTPLAVPGRCRPVTSPVMRTSCPGRFCANCSAVQNSKKSSWFSHPDIHVFIPKPTSANTEDLRERLELLAKDPYEIINFSQRPSPSPACRLFGGGSFVVGSVAAPREVSDAAFCNANKRVAKDWRGDGGWKCRCSSGGLVFACGQAVSC